MPRIRAWFLLGLFVANQAACYSWQAPKVTPQEYAARHPHNDIRIARTNEHGDPDFRARVVLSEVRFSGDSVFGQDPNGEPLAFSLHHVATMEVRSVEGGRTGLAVLGVAIFVAGAILSVSYLMGCALLGPSASLGGASC